MRTLKVIALGLFISMCLGPFAMQSHAQTSLSFNFSDGGIESGLSSGPYATIALSIDTSSNGCSNGCILVKGNTTANFNFFDQTSEGGIFGFNLAPGIAASSISILNCSDTCSKSTNDAYDSIGSYAASVSITGGSGTTPVYYSSTLEGDAFSSFSFDIATTNASGFSSLNQILLYGTGDITELASHICEANGGGCEGSGTTDLVHAYIGVTPEPASYLLFGSGLLALGIFLRKRNGQSGSQI